MKPSLLILAAGLGSRYGSLKQTEQFGPSGETITDYSIYDAIKSGFGKIIFVISPAMEKEFTESFCRKFPSSLDIEYVTQGIHDVPEGYSITPERTKPWGTAHAVLRAAGKIKEPFAVINADDFYGREAYEIISSSLSEKNTQNGLEFYLAGYPIKNTLSKHGTVSRGVLEINSDGYLTNITERTKIREFGNKIVFIDHDGKEYELSSDSLVSMNLLGFSPPIFRYLEKHFNEFIDRNYKDSKVEMYLPSAVDRLIKEEIARVKVLKTKALWFGVTYQEDKPLVMNMIHELISKGI
jgi:UTP-glucose-1-phosphate uridylyltransferase